MPSLPRRKWYPSGPWIDGIRPYEPPASSPKPKQADPTNYKIIKAHEENKFLLVKINYPDCKNYEGNKILLFKDLTLLELVNQKLIDPHFFEKNELEIVSPIARFVPTDEGWNMAIDLIRLN